MWFYREDRQTRVYDKSCHSSFQIASCKFLPFQSNELTPVNPIFAPHQVIVPHHLLRFYSYYASVIRHVFFIPIPP